MLFLLQVTPPSPEAVAAAAEFLKNQGAQTGAMLRDYGALVNVLYLAVGVLGAIVIYLVFFILNRLSNVVTAIDSAVKAVSAPLENTYEKMEREIAEKHAQEIRANETHHQAQLSAQVQTNQLQVESLSRQLDSEREDRRKLTETANNAYREMNEIVAPFTQSNHALAGRMHDVEKALREFGNLVERLDSKP